jgi:hypothetical protein
MHPQAFKPSSEINLTLRDIFKEKKRYAKAPIFSKFYYNTVYLQAVVEVLTPWGPYSKSKTF